MTSDVGTPVGAFDHIELVTAHRPIDGSPGARCPFLGALAATGYLDGRPDSLDRTADLVVAAGAVPRRADRGVRSTVHLIARLRKGLNPVRRMRSRWPGRTNDRLRGGRTVLGTGSGRTGRVDLLRLDRLDDFAVDRFTADETFESGLGADQLKAMVDADFGPARGAGGGIERRLVAAEWSLLLAVMGQSSTDSPDYLRIGEVRALFEQHRLPLRIIQRLNEATR